MGTAYLGVIDCVEQVRLADAEAVREAWLYAFVIIGMCAVLCAEKCARHLRDKRLCLIAGKGKLFLKPCFTSAFCRMLAFLRALF